MHPLYDTSTLSIYSCSLNTSIYIDPNIHLHGEQRIFYPIHLQNLLTQNHFAVLVFHVSCLTSYTYNPFLGVLLGQPLLIHVRLQLHCKWQQQSVPSAYVVCVNINTQHVPLRLLITAAWMGWQVTKAVVTITKCYMVTLELKSFLVYHLRVFQEE